MVNTGSSNPQKLTSELPLLHISLRGENTDVTDQDTKIVRISCYDLVQTQLQAYSGIIFSLDCDQLELVRHRHKIDAFITSGGKALVNGHVAEPFISGLPLWRKYPFRGPVDLALSAINPHPVWGDINLRDLLYRTGVPGKHSFEQLSEIGVAGFYGRGFYHPLPESSTPINGIGPFAATIDFSYKIGRGTVLVHGGMDLDAFCAMQKSTAAVVSALYRWLKEREHTAENYPAHPSEETAK